MSGADDSVLIQPSERRLCGRGDIDQLSPLILRQGQIVGDREDADGVSVFGSADAQRNVAPESWAAGSRW